MKKAKAYEVEETPVERLVVNNDDNAANLAARKNNGGVVKDRKVYKPSVAQQHNRGSRTLPVASKARLSEAPAERMEVQSFNIQGVMTTSTNSPYEQGNEDEETSDIVVGAFRVGLSDEERITSPGMLMPAPVEQDSMRMVATTAQNTRHQQNATSETHRGNTETSSLTSSSIYTSPSRPSLAAELVAEPTLAAAVQFADPEELRQPNEIGSGQEGLARKEVEELRYQVNRNTRRNSILIALLILVVLIAIAAAVTITLVVLGAGGEQDENPSPAPTDLSTGPPTDLSTGPPTADGTEAFIRALLESNGIPIKTDASPQGQAFQHLVAEPFLIGDDRRVLQRYSLLVLWFGTNGPTGWIDDHRGSWATSSDHCDWNRVTCDSDSLVRKLQLCCGNVGSTLPTEIGMLDSINLMDFHRSTLLTGFIPSEIGRLSALTWLDLGDLTGLTPSTIPEEILLESLRWLGLAGSQVVGSLPSRISRLSRITELHMFDNDLTGGDLNNLCDTLETGLIDCDDGINCDCCKQGLRPTPHGVAVGEDCTPGSPTKAPVLSTNPPTMDQNEALIRSLLQSNGVPVKTDSSPQGRAFQHMTADSFFIDNNRRMLQRYSLLVLWFGTDGPTGWIDDHRGSWATSNDHCNWNRVTCNSDSLVRKLQLCCGSVGSTLPTEIGMLDSINLMDFHRSTLLTGFIPSEIGRMSALTWLDLGDLTGLTPSTIPEEILVEPLRWLGLAGSQMAGSVPTRISRLSSMTELYIFDNDLTGGDLNNLCDTLETGLIDCDDGINCDCCKQGLRPTPYGVGVGEECTPASPTKAPVLSTDPPTMDQNEALIRSLLQSNGVPVKTDSSPQDRAFQHMVVDSFFIDNDRRMLQRYSLLVLWFGTNGPTGWIDDHRGSWATSSDHCDWNRVTCDSDSLVRKLQLCCGSVGSTLPTEIGMLDSMNLMDFHRSTLLTGFIPSEIGRLSALTWLDLGDLTGLTPSTIPEEILLESLQWLGLAGSQVMGSLPTRISRLSRITELYLFDNDVTGGDLNGLCDTLELGIIDCDDGIECDCCKQGLRPTPYGVGVGTDCNAILP